MTMMSKCFSHLPLMFPDGEIPDWRINQSGFKYADLVISNGHMIVMIIRLLTHTCHPTPITTQQVVDIHPKKISHCRYLLGEGIPF